MPNAYRPLFQRFAGLGERSDCGQLFAELPTPLEPLAGIAPNLWLKRDDLTGGGYGGNKIRKLEFVLPRAQQSGTRRIVTLGGLGTHHGLATAISCQRLGLGCDILLFDQPINPHVRENLLLMQHFGARLHYRGSMPRTLAAYALHPRRLDPKTYFLFAGASNAIGTAAYVNAAMELDEQITAGEMPEPAAIYCAVGSTGTLAGLTLGLALCDRHIPIYGVRVIDSHLGPFAACTPGTVSGLMQKTMKWMQALDSHVPDLRLPQPLLLDAYFGEGYGAPTPAGERALSLAAEHGLTLDPTYTAKAFAAARDGVRKHRGPVLYWHTLASADFTDVLAGAQESDLPAVIKKRLATNP